MRQTDPEGKAERSLHTWMVCTLID